MIYSIQKVFILLVFIAALVFQPMYGMARSLTGMTGLLTVPTAGMPEDGELFFGVNWLNKKTFEYGSNEYHGLSNYVTMGYLPFLEVSLRLTRMIDFPEPQAMGDRMISVRLRPFEENELLPSVALGIHDFVWTREEFPTNEFNALYLALSKSLYFNTFINRAEFHLGYGTDWLDAKNREFVGPFGGISVFPRSFLSLMLEYDTEKFNCGLQMQILDRAEFLLALMDFKALSGGINYKFGL